MEVSEGRLEEISLVSYECPESLQDPERLQENIECPSENLSFHQVAVREDHMDITKGSLDDISRPASSERSHAGSRDGHISLEVLSPDVEDSRVEESTHETSDCDLTHRHTSDQDKKDTEGDPELEKAIKKMKKLDQILALKVSAEREVKQKGRELHHRLWQELHAVRMSPESSDEMDNTRRFLALTPDSSQGCSEDVLDFVPVFETEVLHHFNLKCEMEGEMNQNAHSSQNISENGCDELEVGYRVTEDHPSDGRRYRAAHSKHRQDFVKKNIEVAGEAGSSVLLTQEERKRLEELLEDIEDIDPTSQHETVSSLCAVSGEGFSPEPSEINSLLHIDSRLQLLLPVQDFLSVRSSPADVIPSQMKTSLWDMRERREQERRLQEIQQQLQFLDETEQIEQIDLSEVQVKIIQSFSAPPSGLSSALDSHITVSRPSSSLLSDLLLETDETEHQIPSD